MVRKSSEQRQIEQLIRQSQSARQCLGRQAVLLRRRLDIPSRLRSSLAGHPTTWMAGSLFSGVAASLLFRRRPVRVKKSKSALVAVLIILAKASRPLFKVWLVNQIKRWLTQSKAATAPGQPVPRPLPEYHSY